MYLYSAPISSGSDVAFAVPCREKKYIQGSGLPQRFTVLLRCIFSCFHRKKIKINEIISMLVAIHNVQYTKIIFA